MAFFNKFSRPGTPENPIDMKPAGGKKPPFHAGRGLAAVAVLAVAAILGFNSFYTINEQENAVVVTFGSPAAVTSPGLHFKVPFVQQVHKVHMTFRSSPIGFDMETR